MWIEIEMYVLLFFACSFLGWCMEVTCKLVQFGRFINRGFLLGRCARFTAQALC